MVKVGGIILAKDEEERIGECLKHIRPYIDFILVIVDSETKDRTVEIAKKYADKVVVKPFSGSFAEERNYAQTLIPKDCGYILWVDADERFDVGFLRKMKKVIETAEKTDQPPLICARFSRVNLPDGKDWPDYQVRLTKNTDDIEWRGDVHEIPYLKSEGIPLDQTNDPKRGDRQFTVLIGDGYPIIHLPRRKDLKRSWWEE